QIEVFGRFEGHPEDHLTLLGQQDGSLFMGARDRVYNLSDADLSENFVVNWPASVEHQEICQIKGQRESECHNFLRVFHGPLNPNDMSTVLPAPETFAPRSGTLMASKKRGKELKLGKDGNNLADEQEQPDEQRYLVCGTHAFKPKCRFYTNNLKNYSAEFSGIGYSPFNPIHPSTSLLHAGMVYAATVADFGGTDALIYRQPLRTEQYYDLQLNSPSFVSSMSHGDLALFFFREFAVEHTNCGKAIFSRVARICRHDTGSRKQKDFTTFLKARLNCSVPGEFPFYFDHIRTFHSFTTAPNSIGASAICAFSIKSIMKAFDGPFKGQSSIDANWLPVPDNLVPKPRPGQCSENPDQVSDSNAVAFVKGHPLMDEAVQGVPVLTTISNEDAFTTIAVDYSDNVAPYHVVYVGTASGKVMKAVVNASESLKPVTLKSFHPHHSVISQSWHLFPDAPIKSLRLVGSRRLLVVTETKAMIIRVDNCAKFSTCGKCVSIRDPHCAWNVDTEECVNADINAISNYDDGNKAIMMLQAINTGISAKCPLGEQDVSPSASTSAEDCCKCSRDCNANSVVTKNNENPGTGSDLLFVDDVDVDDDDDKSLQRNEIGDENGKRNSHKMNKDGENQDYESSFVTAGDAHLSSKSIAVATISSALLSLMIGFPVGFLVCKWLASRQNKTKPSTNAQLAATMNESQRLTKPIDFVVNVSPVNKNPLKNNLNTGTLEKTVKKIYL
ncbi:Semaphorin-1A, partial [Orchesella cincta]